MNEQLGHLAESLAHWLSAWTLVVAGVAAVVLLYRPRRAGICYAAWLLATFAGAVFLPIVLTVQPVVAWERIAREFRASSPAHAPELAERFESWMKPLDNGTLMPAGRESNEARLLAGPYAAETEPVARGIRSAGDTPHTAADNNWQRARLGWSILGAWAIGFTACVARLVFAFVQAQRLIAECGQPTGELKSEFDSALRGQQIRRRVRLLVHPKIPTPVCLGVIRPTVVWPSLVNEGMTLRQRRAAIVHEASHLRRYDDRVNLAAEVWRAVCWFYPPIHWTVSRLRREQEHLCDDLAASHFGESTGYAQMLLDQTGISVRHDALRIAFIGSGLKRRIQRLMRAELRSIEPLGRRKTAALTLLVVVLLVCASSLRLVGFAEDARESPDSPLPEVTLQELSDRIRESLRSYEKGYLEVAFEDVRDTNAFRSGEDKQPKMVTIPGRFRYASDGHRWRGEFEGRTYSAGSTELYPRRWSAGFDGSVHYKWEQPSNVFVFGEQPAHEGIPLPQFFWSSHGEGFPKSLVEKDWRFAGQEVVDGYRCYVLTRKADYDSYQARYELTISPRQSYLPVRYKVFADGKLSWSHELFELQKSAGGVWFPGRKRYVSSYMSQTYGATIVRYESDREYGDVYFNAEVPYGVWVRDHRTGRLHKNDPWWPELEPLLRKEFDWPPVDVTPLRDMTSHADRAMAGKPAPDLRVEKWIHGTPVDLRQRQGKVTLLYFSSGGLWSPIPKQVAALKALYITFKPSGLEIVGINTAADDVAESRQNLRELRIPWPVAVDSTSEESSYGRTFQAYGLKTYASPILVDHEGRVRLVEAGKLADDVKRLLEAAGSQNPPVVSLDFVDMPGEVFSTVNQEWHGWVRDAPKTAKITGKVSDEEGPLPRVEIEATLKLEVAGSPNVTGSTSLFNFRDRFRCTSNDDGSFELSGLCKGTYVLTFSLRGRAIVERKVAVGSHQETVSVDVKLDQRDEIRGLVVDENAQPIAGARVTIRHRHFDVKRQHPYTTYRSSPSVTDRNGEFAFKGLRTGAYTLDVTHDGYKQGTMEQVPAGTADVVIPLERKSP